MCWWLMVDNNFMVPWSTRLVQSLLVLMCLITFSSMRLMITILWHLAFWHYSTWPSHHQVTTVAWLVLVWGRMRQRQVGTLPCGIGARLWENNMERTVDVDGDLCWLVIGMTSATRYPPSTLGNWWEKISGAKDETDQVVESLSNIRRGNWFRNISAGVGLWHLWHMIRVVFL